MNPFQNTIQNIDHGNLSEDLDEKLTELIGKVKERGKAGTITLKLKVKPLDADGESVAVVANVTVAEPPKAERASIFFTTDENQLVRDNPKQAELNLKPVPKAASKVEPVAKAS